MPRYELDGKFWEVAIEGSVVTTCSGTKQRRGVETPREHVDARAARRDYDALIETRTNAGYQLVVEAGPPGATGARNAELEAAIAAAPDEVEPYLVYADWLQSRGDPRGELITLQHAMRAAGNTEGFAKFRVHEEVLRGTLADVIEALHGGLSQVEREPIKAAFQASPKDSPVVATPTTRSRSSSRSNASSASRTSGSSSPMMTDTVVDIALMLARRAPDG